MIRLCIKAENKAAPFCYLGSLYSDSHYSAIMGTFNYEQNLGIPSQEMVFPMVPTVSVLFVLLLCASDRPVLFLSLASGASESTGMYL